MSFALLQSVFLPMGVFASDAAGDIVWAGDPITSKLFGGEGQAYIYFFERSPGPGDFVAEYWDFDAEDQEFAQVLDDSVMPISDEEYIVKYDVVSVESGSPVVTIGGLTGEEGNWFELRNIGITLSTISEYFVDYIVILNVSVAQYLSGDPEAGTALPVPGTTVVRQVTLHGQNNSPA